MALIAGVDGGNTKTVAVVCDLEGRALGIGRGGCGNWEAIGEAKAAQVITEVVAQALAAAGGAHADLAHAHMGLAGLDWPDDEPRLRKALAGAGWGCALTLENDSFLAVRACAPEGHGIGVTAGTAVASGILRPDGEKYFYGGFTDLGGGFDIDAQTVHAVIRADDGRGPSTALAAALLRATGHASVTALVYEMHRRGYHAPHAMVRPVLFATAAQGDPVAVDIATRFGAELALCATNLMRRYELLEKDPAVVAAGSLFTRTGPLLFEVFRQQVLRAAARAQVMLADQPPVMGAVRGALAACGRDQPEAWERARQSASAQGWV